MQFQLIFLDSVGAIVKNSLPLMAGRAKWTMAEGLHSWLMSWKCILPLVKSISTFYFFLYGMYDYKGASVLITDTYLKYICHPPQEFQPVFFSYDIYSMLFFVPVFFPPVFRPSFSQSVSIFTFHVGSHLSLLDFWAFLSPFFTKKKKKKSLRVLS